MNNKLEKAIFAGGCFWCMVEPFDEQPGIESIVSGYTGGHVENPTYEQVCADNTGHVEAVEITFNPDIFPYEDLVELFWRQIDQTDAQKTIAENSKQALIDSGKFKKPIVTPIVPAEPFYEAEEEHQYYYKRNHFHYKLYKKGSGRQQFIEKNWKNTYDKADLKNK